MARFILSVNNHQAAVDVAEDTPLLYVLANELNLKGPRFGCGLAQCGSCSVLMASTEVRACVTPVSTVGDQEVTTLEGLPAFYARQNKLAATPELHPLQKAFVEEQAPQCGYCYNGMIVKGAELLSHNSSPAEAEIRDAMSGHLCRCGSYPRVIKAIQRAASAMRTATKEG